MASDALLAALVQGDRRSLAKTITLLESTRPADRVRADALLSELMPHVRTANALRIGVSGIPGVGKSSFLEGLGSHLLKANPSERMAILAVDPSSPLAGGSILADKTRMATLASDQRVFIRPSPSGGALGGLGRRTREILLLMEAAGYKRIFVETVGIGQSETLVAGMVDIFLLLQMPATGDELQSMKKGVLELADLVIVHKADGSLLEAARLTKGQLEQAFGLWTRAPCDEGPKVLLASSLVGEGMERVASELAAFHARQLQSGAHHTRRRTQAAQWFEEECASLLREELLRTRGPRASFAELREQVLAGTIPASVAAAGVLKAWRAGLHKG